MPFLVAARILQGLGGRGLISVSQASIADVVAPRERGRYQGYISAAFAVASVSGPLLGGFLTSYLSWRWVFWINLPLGAVAMVISRRALTRLHTPRIKRPVDYPGAVLMTIALAPRSEEHTSELQSLLRISYAVFCLKHHKPHIDTHISTTTS